MAFQIPCPKDAVIAQLQEVLRSGLAQMKDMALERDESRMREEQLAMRLAEQKSELDAKGEQLEKSIKKVEILKGRLAERAAKESATPGSASGRDGEPPAKRAAFALGSPLSRSSLSRRSCDMKSTLLSIYKNVEGGLAEQGATDAVIVTQGWDHPVRVVLHAAVAAINEHEDFTRVTVASVSGLQIDGLVIKLVFHNREGHEIDNMIILCAKRFETCQHMLVQCKLISAGTEKGNESLISIFLLGLGLVDPLERAQKLSNAFSEMEASVRRLESKTGALFDGFTFGRRDGKNIAVAHLAPGHGPVLEPSSPMVIPSNCQGFAVLEVNEIHALQNADCERLVSNEDGMIDNPLVEALDKALLGAAGTPSLLRLQRKGWTVSKIERTQVDLEDSISTARQLLDGGFIDSWFDKVGGAVSEAALEAAVEQIARSTDDFFATLSGASSYDEIDFEALPSLLTFAARSALSMRAKRVFSRLFAVPYFRAALRLAAAANGHEFLGGALASDTMLAVVLHKFTKLMHGVQLAAAESVKEPLMEANRFVIATMAKMSTALDFSVKGKRWRTKSGLNSFVLRLLESKVRVPVEVIRNTLLSETDNHHTDFESLRSALLDAVADSLHADVLGAEVATADLHALTFSFTNKTQINIERCIGSPRDGEARLAQVLNDISATATAAGAGAAAQ